MTKPLWVDAHCHLDDPRFDALRPDAIAEARATGIGGWLVAGVDTEQWQRADKLALEVPGVVPIFGLHPWSVARMDPETLASSLAELAVRPMAGLGETGLDASKYVPRGSLPAQRDAFRAQLAIARERHLPVVLHVLLAHGEALDVLERDGIGAGGMVHSYSGPSELVPRYEALGLCLSFSASITRPTARRSLEAAARVHPDRLLIETDCPDQPPEGRGAINRPVFLWDVARAVGAVRGESAEATLTRSTDSIRRVFPGAWPASPVITR